MAQTKENHNKNGSVRNKTTSTSRPIANESPKKLMKLVVFRPVTNSLLEIRTFQQFDKLIIKKAPFYRLLDELLMDLFLERDAKLRDGKLKREETYNGLPKPLLAIYLVTR